MCFFVGDVCGEGQALGGQDFFRAGGEGDVEGLRFCGGLCVLVLPLRNWSCDHVIGGVRYLGR